MSLREIKERMAEDRGLYDHVAWSGLCSRCGKTRHVFAPELIKIFGESDVDLNYKDVDIECNARDCKGRVTNLHRMSPSRALHLNDIKRR